MVVRREKVILDLEDNFTAGMLAAAAATKLLDHELGSLDRSTVIAHQHVKSFTDDDRGGINSLAKQAGIANSQFEDLSARTLILADSLAMLVPTIAPLGAVAIPGIMGIASALGFATLATGGAVLAFQGVFDAVSKLNKAALEPTETNLKNANLAMEQLAPSAQELARHIQELRPAFQDLRDASANGMFPGIDQSLTNMERLLPTLEQVAFTIGSVTGDIAASGSKSLASARWAPFFQFLNDEARPTLEQTARSAGALAHGLAEMWMAFEPLNRDVGNVLEDAATSFDHWATALSKTEGFTEFVDYVRTSAPQVGDTLASIANSLLQIVEATSEIGDPALRILGQFADVVATIADSPIGPTLMAGVAAMALMRMEARFLDSAMRSGPVKSVTLLRDSLVEMKKTAPGMVAWGRSASDIERYNKAAAGAWTATKSLVKPAALVGALALATSGAADSMGLMNTASLAVMGAMATGGPWGAAVGGAIGLVLDLAEAHKRADEAAKDFAGTLDQQTGALTENSRAWVVNQIGGDNLAKIKDMGLSLSDVTDALLAGGDAWSQFKEQADLGSVVTSTNGRGAHVNQQLGDDLNKVADAVAAGKEVFGLYSEGVYDAAGSMQAFQKEAQQTIEAMRALRQEALRAENAQLDYNSSLLDLKDALKDNKHTLNEHTRAGIENRRTALDMAAAWNQLSDEAQNQPGAYRAAKKALADFLHEMGMARGEALRYAETLLNIPSDIYSKMHAETDAAKAQILSFKRWLDQQNFTKSVRIINNSGMGPQVTGADGATVPKTGLPYADRHLALVADGEEIVSNRFGQADRHRSLLKAISANRFADGGTAGASYLRGKGDTASDQVDELGRAARDSAKSIKDETKARKDAAKQRRSDAASTVSGLFATDPFATDSVWGATDPTAVLNADTASARLLRRQIHKLRSRGLNGAALASVYNAQDPMAAAAQLSGMSKAQLRKYEQAFNRRSRVAHQTGVYAGAAAFGGGDGGTQLMAELLTETNGRLAAIEGELRTHPHRYAAELKSSVRRGNHRRRTDGKGEAR